MTLKEIERLGRSNIKKQDTKLKNLAEDKKKVQKKLAEIDKKLLEIESEKKRIRAETRKKIVDFAKTNF